ncbi:hypothetical protein PFISCL1PPCAC_5586, partial [Pristionchus fissidentatus]
SSLAFRRASSSLVWCSRRITTLPTVSPKLATVPALPYSRAVLQSRGFCSEMMANPMSHRIVWMDCEMTGLEVETQTLVEIAVIVTDAQLNIVAEGPDIVIHQDDETLSKMNDWCKETFAKNGLTQRIRDSTVNMKEAEDKVLEFLKTHVMKGKSPLAGNTIYMDRLFIRKYMPRIDEFLHYRLIDVSTIKELSYRWYPSAVASAPAKAMTHRALDDIRESIDELKHYRKNIFK